MINLSNDALNRTFQALADPTRREILARLAEQDLLTISEIAKPFQISLPAIMKHLDVLAASGLVTREKTGRTVHCHLMAEPLGDAVAWLNTYQQFWSDQLQSLANLLETPTCPNPNAQASQSNAKSKQRRRRSSTPGSTQKR